MKVFGVFLMLAAVGVFYGLFFKLAPYIASLIPVGDWHALLALIVYAVIGWVGGIALPIFLLISGLFMFFIGRR